jgi:hypothetical protein
MAKRSLLSERPSYNNNNNNNRPDIRVKNQREKVHTDRCVNTSGQKCHAKGGIKEIKIQEFVYRDRRSVEYEIYDCIGNNWGHRNSNKRFKAKCGSHNSKPLDRFTTTDSCASNITHNTESTAV